MFSDLQRIKNQGSWASERRSWWYWICLVPWLSGPSSAFRCQKSPSQHLLRKFLSKELQKRSTSINIPGTNSSLCSVHSLLCRLSLFDFPIKAKLDLKGSAPLSKDLFLSIVMEVNALRREMYLKERLKCLPSWIPLSPAQATHPDFYL